MTATLTILPDGTVTGLYNEIFPLPDYGHMTMRRASVIEFNEPSQTWEVLTPDGKTVLHSHPSRNACLAWEHENADLLCSLTPS